ncbi:thioredoxin-like protein HCF164, chloroplastic isoform X2 [Physcomitrium patens]
MAAVATVCSTQTLRFMPTIGLQRTRSKTTSRSLVSIDSEKHWTNLELKKSPASTWVCMSKPEDQEIVPPVPPPDCCNQKETEEVTQVASETAKENATPVEVFQQIGPSKQMNRLIALGSVVFAVGLFVSGRLEGVARPGLSQLSANAVPYEEALANGRPTVVEFYADWCEVCREMAKDVYQVEEEYRDRINFVMLNVDNPKWEPELDEFGVEGIPHFAFLDAKGNEEGNIVGRLPPKFLRENVMALAKGETAVPHSSVVGSFSSADSRQAPQLVGPRSHSEN